MHELWLCKNIMEIILQKANDIKCHKIKKISLIIGSQSMIDKSSLLFSLDIITKNTVAEHATLEIIENESNDILVKSMEVE